MTPIAERISHLSDRFEALIENVSPGDWGNQSPCDEWSARDVVRHVVDVHQMMLRPLDRSLSPAPSVDDDPLGAFQAARADIAGVLDDPDLATTDTKGSSAGPSSSRRSTASSASISSSTAGTSPRRPASR